MKSPNKLVAPLLVGMLTVGSVCSANMFDGFDMNRVRTTLGNIVSSVADSSVAKTLTHVGHKVIANPGRTGAALAVIVTFGCVAYRCWQNFKLGRMIRPNFDEGGMGSDEGGMGSDD